MKWAEQIFTVDSLLPSKWKPQDSIQSLLLVSERCRISTFVFDNFWKWVNGEIFFSVLSVATAVHSHYTSTPFYDNE